MLCMARLIRAMFGLTAVADRMLECGLNSIVLGIDLNMNSAGYMCRLAAEKTQKRVTYKKLCARGACRQVPRKSLQDD